MKITKETRCSKCKIGFIKEVVVSNYTGLGEKCVSKIDKCDNCGYVI